MTDRFTVLTVCTGNVHRSVLAEHLLATWAEWYLPGDLAAQVQVASAGTAAPAGASMGRRVRAIATELQAAPRKHTATPITDALLEGADLVLVASRHHREEVLGRVPAGLRRTFTIREAGRLAASMPVPPGARSIADLRSKVGELAAARVPAADPADDDVFDPQGHGDDAYLRMVGESVPALADLARFLFGMPSGDVTAYAEAADDDERLRARITRDGTS